MVKLFFDIDLPIIMKRREERVFSRKTVRSKKGKKEDSKFAELHEEVAKSWFGLSQSRHDKSKSRRLAGR